MCPVGGTVSALVTRQRHAAGSERSIPLRAAAFGRASAAHLAWTVPSDGRARDRTGLCLVCLASAHLPPCGPGGRAWRGALRVPSQAVPRSLREPAGNTAPAFDDEEEPQETRDQPCLSTRRPRALLSPSDLLSRPVGGGCPHLSPHPGLEWLWRTVGGGESSCSRRTLWPRQAGWGRVAGCTRRGCIFLSRECGSLGEEGGGTRSQTHHHLEQQLFWAPSCRARAGVPGARKRRSFRGRSGGGAGPAPRTGGLGGEGRRQRHQPRHPEPRAP